MSLKDRITNDIILIRVFDLKKRDFEMSNKIRIGRKIPFLKDSLDKSPVLREVRFGEVRKSLIRKEKLALEPIANQDVTRLIIRYDDSSKPWYITHV